MAEQVRHPERAHYMGECPSHAGKGALDNSERRRAMQYRIKRERFVGCFPLVRCSFLAAFLPVVHGRPPPKADNGFRRGCDIQTDDRANGCHTPQDLHPHRTRAQVCGSRPRLHTCAGVERDSGRTSVMRLFTQYFFGSSYFFMVGNVPTAQNNLAWDTVPCSLIVPSMIVLQGQHSPGFVLSLQDNHCCSPYVLGRCPRLKCFALSAQE